MVEAAGKVDRVPRSMAGAPAWLAGIAIAALGVGLAWIVRVRWQSDVEAWLVQHRRECHEAAEQTAWRVSALLHGVAVRLRGLARLPGVRGLTGHETALDGDVRSILEDTVHDPAGLRLASLHALAVAPGHAGGVCEHAAGQPPDGSTRARIGRQFARWRELYANDEAVDPSRPPAQLDGEPARAGGAPGEEAHATFVLSVPWFAGDRRLGGCVTAVFAADAVAALLLRGEYALVGVDQGVVVAAGTAGPCQNARELVARGQPDRRLFYSEVLPLEVPGGGRWLLWAGRPDAAFFVRSDVHASTRTAELGHAATAVLTLALAWVVVAKRRSRREIDQALHGLECRVLDRTYELQQSSRAKSQILVDVSKGIRTPTRELAGSADRLLAGVRDGAARDEALETIKRSSDSLLAIANEVLDFARLEAGALPIVRERLSPHELIEQVASAFRPRAAARGLRFTVEHATPLPATIATDAARVRQILNALFELALRHTERGGIRLVVSLQQTDERRPLLEVQVVDTGRGLDAGQLARLFTPFLSADDSNRGTGGPGLGLLLAHRLAQLLDGTIHARSVVGAGTTCTLLLGTGPLAGVPLVTCPAPAGPVRSMARLMARDGQLRVLLIEDGAGEQHELATALRGLGAEVSLADDARIGCELALEMRREGQEFDLILMDMELPDLDGYAATARLRAADYRGAIVALARDAADRGRSQAAGCDEQVEKPVDARRLADVFARLAGDASG